MRIWIVKEWYVYPFAWMLAGENYARSMDDLIRMLVPLWEQNRSLETLHVLSHGNRRRDEAGNDIGHYVEMGGGDRIDTNDFDPQGNVLPDTCTALLINWLHWVMRPGSRLIFSACGQGDGALLSLISRHLMSSVTVSGFRNLGHPFGRGNIAFRNGSPIRP